MICKTFEIRDKHTFIPVIAIQLQPSCEKDRYLFSRAGYGRDADAQKDYILLGTLNGGQGKLLCDPYDWGGSGRTFQVAHQYIIASWDKLTSGQVIDVEHILGETAQPKQSEADEGFLL